MMQSLNDLQRFVTSRSTTFSKASRAAASELARTVAIYLQRHVYVSSQPIRMLAKLDSSLRATHLSGLAKYASASAGAFSKMPSNSLRAVVKQ